MHNIKKIDEFLPEPKFQAMDLKDVFPTEVLNEKLGEGSNLNGKKLSSPSVGDWLWDFDLKIEDFPLDGNPYGELLVPDKKLSIFLAQMVNTFALESWELLNRDETFDEIFGEEGREKVRKKLRGTFVIKKNLDVYKSEMNQVYDYFDKLYTFIGSGYLGLSLQRESDSIILSSDVDVHGGKLGAVWSSIKSFFQKSSWKRSLFWLVSNVSSNRSHAKWLTVCSGTNGAEYTTNAIKSGISPDINTAFEAFILYGGLKATLPKTERATTALNYATSRVVQWTIKKKDEAGKEEQWNSVLMNTDLFGLFQKIAIVSTCKWVYSIILGRQSRQGFETMPQAKYDDVTPSLSGYDVINYRDTKCYYLSYTSEEFMDLLEALASLGRIGSSKFNNLIDRINNKKDPRLIINDVKSEIKSWMTHNGWTRDKYPEMKALGTDGSTRLIIPILILNSIMSQDSKMAIRED